jgi:fluoroacetyl-CoA thioesterase
MRPGQADTEFRLHEKEEIKMNTDIFPGITHTLSLHVNDRLLVTAFAPHFSGFADLPPVFATAFMVGFMEWACIEALRPYLDDDENTVGTHVYLSHVAPTALGMKVTANVELMEVKGLTLRFRVDCYDECDLIGSGFHERTVIDTDRFMAKVRRKVGQTALLAA